MNTTPLSLKKFSNNGTVNNKMEELAKKHLPEMYSNMCSGFVGPLSFNKQYHCAGLRKEFAKAIYNGKSCNNTTWGMNYHLNKLNKNSISGLPIIEGEKKFLELQKISERDVEQIDAKLGKLHTETFSN